MTLMMMMMMMAMSANVLSTCRARRHIVSPRAQLVEFTLNESFNFVRVLASEG